MRHTLVHFLEAGGSIGSCSGVSTPKTIRTRERLVVDESDTSPDAPRELAGVSKRFPFR